MKRLINWVKYKAKRKLQRKKLNKLFVGTIQEEEINRIALKYKYNFDSSNINN